VPFMLGSHSLVIGQLFGPERGLSPFTTGSHSPVIGKTPSAQVTS
jgi:hypothetical protein